MVVIFVGPRSLNLVYWSGRDVIHFGVNWSLKVLIVFLNLVLVQIICLFWIRLRMGRRGGESWRTHN